MTGAIHPRFKRYEAALVAMGFCTWGFIFMDRMAVSILMPIIQPFFDITNTQVGLISFITSLLYAISAILFSSLANKSLHRKNWMVIFVLLTAIFSGLCCVARSFGMLLVFRALLGFAEGPILPLIYAFVANSSSENKYGRNTGIINAGVACIAATLGPVLITQLVGVMSWQMTFLCASIPTFVMVVLLFAFVKEGGIDKTTGAAIKTSPLLELQAKEEETPKEKVKFSQLIKNRNFILCCFIQILACGGYWLITTYGSLYLVNVSGFEVAVMGIAASLMGLLTIAWDIFVPKFSDDFGRKKLCIIGYGCAVLAPLAMFLAPGNMVSVVFYVIFGGCFGAAFAVVAGVIPNESLPPQYATVGVAIVMGLGDFLGAACLPLLGGVIADAYGLAAMMLCGVVVGVVAVILCCFLKESNPKVLAKRAAKAGLPAPEQESISE